MNIIYKKRRFLILYGLLLLTGCGSSESSKAVAPSPNVGISSSAGALPIASVPGVSGDSGFAAFNQQMTASSQMAAAQQDKQMKNANEQMKAMAAESAADRAASAKADDKSMWIQALALGTQLEMVKFVTAPDSTKCSYRPTSYSELGKETNDIFAAAEKQKVPATGSSNNAAPAAPSPLSTSKSMIVPNRRSSGIDSKS